MSSRSAFSAAVVMIASATVPATAVRADPPPAATLIEEIVMYAVDADTNYLMRYVFSSNTFTIIGEVKTETGVPLVKMEALAYVPQGMYKGLYVVPAHGPFKGHLAHVDPLTAVATVYSHQLVTDNHSKITGMTEHFAPLSPQQWSLLAVQCESGDPGDDVSRELVEIHLDDGTGLAMADLGEGHGIEGLARDARGGPYQGELFATTRSELLSLPLVDGAYTVEPVGVTGLDKAEALEFALGQAQPRVEVPGIDSSWTEFGTLFAFDDQFDRFGVLNPDTGEFLDYLVCGVPSTFSAQDAEGIAFVVVYEDAHYGCFD